MIKRQPIAMLLVVTGLVLSSCGNDSELQTDLIGSEWVVVSMTGFPDDNLVEGDFDFTSERFRFHDGTNFFSRDINWSETGFTLAQGGDETLVGTDPEQPGSYLSTFAEIGATVEVVMNPDGSLTLTRDDQVITAEPE